MSIRKHVSAICIFQTIFHLTDQICVTQNLPHFFPHFWLFIVLLCLLQTRAWQVRIIHCFAFCCPVYCSNSTYPVLKKPCVTLALLWAYRWFQESFPNRNDQKLAFNSPLQLRMVHKVHETQLCIHAFTNTTNFTTPTISQFKKNACKRWK